MDLNFLTDQFLIKNTECKGPVIVTGAGGCIGSWVLAILHRSNIPCVGVDLSLDKKRVQLLLDSDSSKITWDQCDITDFTSLKKLINNYNAKAIIHLAGLQVPFCSSNPSLGARVNVEGTINIFQIARENNIKRTVYASSVAALGMPPKGLWKETLYGAYKLVNEHSAYVYWSDWQVPSIGIRPNIVYGLGRDQGISSKNTIALQAASLGLKYEIPYTGQYSWLYAGEAASAFITCVSEDMKGADVYNLNGSCQTIKYGLSLLDKIKPDNKVTCSGSSLPFPSDLDDSPLRDKIGDYPSISIEEGVSSTIKAFDYLKSVGRCPSLPI